MRNVQSWTSGASAAGSRPGSRAGTQPLLVAAPPRRGAAQQGAQVEHGEEPVAVAPDPGEELRARAADALRARLDGARLQPDDARDRVDDESAGAVACVDD